MFFHEAQSQDERHTKGMPFGKWTTVTPEERHAKIEDEIDKQNEAIRGLIAVGRTCLTSIQELTAAQRAGGERHDREIAEIRELHKDIDYKLNALIAEVDRIIRKDPGPEGNPS